MPRPRTDSLCVRLNLCVSNEINDTVEKHKAQLRLQDKKVSKLEAAERYFEMVHEFYKKNKPK